MIFSSDRIWKVDDYDSIVAWRGSGVNGFGGLEGGRKNKNLFLFTY
jgi:hypothetical protein